MAKKTPAPAPAPVSAGAGVKKQDLENVWVLLTALQEHGPATARELAKATGLEEHRVNQVLYAGARDFFCEMWKKGNAPVWAAQGLNFNACEHCGKKCGSSQEAYECCDVTDVESEEEYEIGLSYDAEGEWVFKCPCCMSVRHGDAANEERMWVGGDDGYDVCIDCEARIEEEWAHTKDALAKKGMTWEVV